MMRSMLKLRLALRRRRWTAGVAVFLLLGSGLARAVQDSAAAATAAGPYLHVGKGSPLFQNDSEPVAAGRWEHSAGPAWDTSLGWNFNSYEAAGLEFGFAGAGSNNVPGFSLNNPRLANVPVLANVTLSLPRPGCRWMPYLGAGAGGDDVVYAPEGFGQGVPSLFGNQNDVVFAWQAFAGWKFRMNDRLSLGLGYKYFAAGNPAGPSVIDSPAAADGVRNHSLLLTLRLKF